MENYQDNVLIVIKTLKKFCYSTAELRTHETCLEKLRIVLMQENVTSYSPQIALQWSKYRVPKYLRSSYTHVVYRLNDVYKFGHIHATHLRINRHLSIQNKRKVENYIDFLKTQKRYTPIVIVNIKQMCERFCCFAQYYGAKTVVDTTYAILERYYLFIREATTKYNYKHYLGNLRGFFEYLAKQGYTRGYGYSLFLHYRKWNVCTTLDDLTENAKTVIRKYKEESLSFPLDEFYHTIQYFSEKLVKSGYSESILDFSRLCLSYLYLFLDRENIGYHRSIVEAWYEDVGASIFKANAIRARRILEMYDDYTKEGDVLPDKRWHNPDSLYNHISSYYKKILDIFLDTKKKEGLGKKTIDNYKLNCSKFFLFLTSHGIKSLDMLNQEAIKKFLFSDSNLLAESKRICSIVLRKFIVYLEIHNVVPRNLHLAIPHGRVVREKIVEVFDEHDKELIREYCKNASTPTALRDAAILQLGMTTGLRASDIAFLRKMDIDWKNQFISIVQRKTKKLHRHPLETATLNAIFRYIKYGRPKKAHSDYIFVIFTAPYRHISRSTCNGALKRAGVSIKKFHQLRRTFGTDSLKSGITYAETAELLGQSSNETVHKYVALDEERMHLCPLSLSETGLTMKGRYEHA